MEENESLEQIVVSYRNGAEKSAEALVERLYGRVISIVRGHCPRSCDEEDVAQEIFMKVFSKIDQFKGHQPFEHWVSRISLNTCYDMLRKQKARPLRTYTDLNIEEVEFVEAALNNKESSSDFGLEVTEELLEKLLSALKPAEQMAVRLLDLDELSVKEACEVTGWGASKMKVTAMRARKKLREKLRHLESEKNQLIARV